MKNKKFVMIASEGTNIGKSYLARVIKSSHNDCNILSFSTPLKDSCDKEFKVLYPFVQESFTHYYSDRKYKDQPLSKINENIKGKLSKFTLREFLIKVSDLYKSKYGSDIFVNKSVIETSKLKSKLIVFDDFRLPYEYGYLKERYGSENILTVHIDKPDKKDSKLNSYEGALKDFKFDIEFTYTENYDNLDSLLTLLGKFIYD